MNTFDINGATDNGTWDHPIRSDGAQDLVLVFKPPVDENGNAISQLDYAFEVFYQDGSGAQIEVDGDATWTTPIANWTPERYEIAAASLALAGGLYTVTLPKEIFPDTVVDTNGSSQAVGFYKIDIAPQKNGNNSAIMLAFDKL